MGYLEAVYTDGLSVENANASDKMWGLKMAQAAKMLTVTFFFALWMGLEWSLQMFSHFKLIAYLVNLWLNMRSKMYAFEENSQLLSIRNWWQRLQSFFNQW